MHTDTIAARALDPVERGERVAVFEYSPQRTTECATENGSYCSPVMPRRVPRRTVPP